MGAIAGALRACLSLEAAAELITQAATLVCSRCARFLALSIERLRRPAQPSEQTAAVAALIERLLPKYLDESCFAVVNGAKDQMVALLDLPWDHIFFTGSGNVGKIVAQSAAKHLTPTTLELGGKSPCIVLDDANVDTAARRIIWGKHVNAAQTCIAPDYVLCSKEMQPKLIEGFRKALKRFYPKGETPLQGTTYCRLISGSAHERISGAIRDTQGKVVIGGDRNDKQIDVTVVSDVQLDDPLMQMELFGPVLPIVVCPSKEEAVNIINSRCVRPLRLLRNLLTFI